MDVCNLSSLFTQVNIHLKKSNRASYKIFEKLKTDEDRTKFISNVLERFNITNNITSEKFQKNELEAQKCQQEGQNLSQKGAFKDSLSCFNEGLLFAPAESEVVAELYESRSASLFELKYYSECIEDSIKATLSPFFPQNFRCRALIRRANAYKRLKNYNSAVQCYQEAKLYCGTATPEQSIHENWLKSMNNLIEECIEHANTEGLIGNKHDLQSTESLPTPIGCIPHTDMPCVSKNVELRYNKTMGRHLVAKEKICIGNVIIKEGPSAIFLDIEYRNRRCCHCFAHCVAPLPCNTCSWASFCSKNCQDLASPYHSIECCAMMNIMDFCCNPYDIDVMLVVRILVSTHPKILDYYTFNPTPKNPMKAGFTDGIYFSDNFETMYHLVRHSERRATDQLLRMSLMAVCIVKLLTPFLEKAERYAGLTLRFLQIVSVNSLKVSEIFSNVHGKSNMYIIGTGLYTSSSLLSHSCKPNTTGVSFGNKLIFYSIEPILAGEIISICYCSRYYEEPRSTRQFQLEKYFFRCTCIACTRLWPLESSLPMVPLDLTKNIFQRVNGKLLKIEGLFNFIRNAEITYFMYKKFCDYVSLLKMLKSNRPCLSYEICQQCIEKFLAQKGNKRLINPR